MKALSFAHFTGDITAEGNIFLAEQIKKRLPNVPSFEDNMKDWKRMMADEKGCPGVCFKLTEVYFLPPVVPSKFLCVGLNYRDHAKECRKEIPKVEEKKS